jgi:hypothetical protein
VVVARHATMSIFWVFSLLFGVVLGLRFTVLSLAPAIMVTFFAALVTCIARAEASWIAVLTIGASLASLQIGYFLGLAARHRLIRTPGNPALPGFFVTSASARRRGP